MKSLNAYIPIDRCLAIANRQNLPNRMQGAVLFADISGYTPLTAALMRELGDKQGVDLLTQYINRVFESLIAEVHRYGGSVISFGGDAITCWLNEDNGFRAIACALAMQQAMVPFLQIQTPAGEPISLKVKIALAVGPIRRFQIGDPSIQHLDVLAGKTLEEMAAAGEIAQKSEIIVGSDVVSQLGDLVVVAEWRTEEKEEVDNEPSRRFAVITGLNSSSQAVSQTDFAELLQFATTPFSPIDYSLSESQIRPWLLPPVYEELKNSQGNFLADIRPVVALFLRFSGLDYDRDDQAGEKLDTYIQWIQQVLARYEGYLLKLTIGDKGSNLLASFGAPLLHDDDASRAVAAALELRSPPSQFDFIQEVQIGLSQGRMLAGAFGSDIRCAYDLLGNEANIAARLMMKAEPGQILVSQRVANAAEKSRRFRDLGLMEIKGRQDHLHVFEAISGRPIPIPTFTTPLVGREAELAGMSQLLEATLSGHGQILRLEGPAGIGKSHLTTEFIKQAISRGFKVGLGTCDSASQKILYYPWRQIFRTLFDLVEKPFAKDWVAATPAQITRVKAKVKAINSDWLSRLPLLDDLLDLPPDDVTIVALEPPQRQEATFAIAVEILKHLAKNQPLLLVIEDMHWMDEEASAGLTLTLSRSLADTPLLLMLVHRPLPPIDKRMEILDNLSQLSSYQHLTLLELPPTEIATLVTNRLPGQLSDLALSIIQIQAQGNPFYAEELVLALRESNWLQYHSESSSWGLSESNFHKLRQANCLVKDILSGQWLLAPDAPLSAVDLGLPDSVHRLVLARFDRLNEKLKLTLKTASVIGQAFEFEVLAQARPNQPEPTTLLAQMTTLIEHEFIRVEPTARRIYTFRHQITQEVIYESLLESQQALLHRAVGQALEQVLPGTVERLAYHYFRSEARDKSLFYLDKAAHKTRREFANETAYNYFSQALTLEERWVWRKGRAEVLHILGRRDEEKADLERLEVMLSQEAESQRSGEEISSTIFAIAYLWGQYYEAIGEYAQAKAAIEQALATHQDFENDINKARCLIHFGAIAHRQGDYESAQIWHSQALALLQGQNDYANEQGRALNGLGNVCRQQGQYDQATDYYKQALALSGQNGNQPGEAEALNNLGITAFYQRQFAQAQAYHQETLQIRRAIGDRSGEGNSLINLAQVMRDSGNYSQAQAHFMEALIIQQITGNRWNEQNVWNDLGGWYYELGDLVTAQTSLERGLQLSQEIGDEAGRAYLLCNLGLVMYEQGDLDTATKLLAEGLTLAQTQREDDLASSFFSYLSMAYLKTDRLDRAIEAAQAALALRQELGLYPRTADDMATLAAIHLAAGELTVALEKAQQTLTVLEKCNDEGPEFPQRAYFICYQVLTVVGEVETAGAALQSAYHLVMSRANKITDPTLRQSFLEQVAINREIIAEYLKRSF